MPLVGPFPLVVVVALAGTAVHIAARGYRADAFRLADGRSRVALRGAAFATATVAGSLAWAARARAPR